MVSQITFKAFKIGGTRLAGLTLRVYWRVFGKAGFGSSIGDLRNRTKKLYFIAK
ncbi:MAG: hypothetical protein ACJAWV_000626 [Flammeovirgaceae bacterium]|jgi:hypothetical protein